MANPTNRRLAVPQRIVVVATAVAMIVLSVAAGLFQHDPVRAQSTRPAKPPENVILPGGPNAGVAGGVPGGVPGGVEGGVAGGVTGGIRGGVRDGVPGGVVIRTTDPQAPNALEPVQATLDIPIQFDNPLGAPLIITEARVKVVPRDSLKKGAVATTASSVTSDRVLEPILTLINDTNQRIRGWAVSITHPESDYKYHFEHAGLAIEPAGSFSSRLGGMSFLSLDLHQLKARILGVRFEDGRVWGELAPVPPSFAGPRPPAPPEAASGSSASASTRPKVPGEPSVASATAGHSMALPPGAVGAAHPSSARPSRVRATTATSAVAVQPVRPPGWPLPPPIARSPRSASGAAAGSSPAYPASGNARLLRFGGGTLQDQALKPVPPAYPPRAQEAGITGTVVVEVIVSEEGRVESAHAISGQPFGLAEFGHPLLEEAALAAARQWQFKPATWAGAPAKMIGELFFRFPP